MKWKLFTVSFILACSLLPGFVLAQNKAVVIPLIEDSRPLKNVVRVSSDNGDYKTIQAAVNAITNSSTNNPYLIVVGPGKYTLSQPLILKEGMHIVGSGKNEVTEIEGAIGGATKDSSSALITLRDACTLSNLHINNTYSTGSTYQIGVLMNGALIDVDNVQIVVHGAENAYSAIAMNGSATITNSYISASGNQSTGVEANSTVTMNNVDMWVNGNTSSVGVVDSASYAVHIRNSTIYSNNAAIEIYNSESTIVQTMLDGTTIDHSGTKNCLDTYDSSLNFVSC